MMLTVQNAQVWCQAEDQVVRPGLPTVVFVHGALNDHRVWAAQSHYFGNHGYNALAPDLPAHGHSGGTPRISVDELAAWLLAVLDAAGVQRAALVGHSMGALVALEAAARAPERVSHLALVGCTYPMTVAPALLETALHDEAKAIEQVTRWSHTPGHPAARATRELMRELAGIHPHQLLYTDLAACNSYAGGEAAARAVRCPTLFLFGAGDVMTPPTSAGTLAAAIPHAQMVTVQAGHAMMAEQPEAVSAALARFLGQR